MKGHTLLHKHEHPLDSTEQLVKIPRNHHRISDNLQMTCKRRVLACRNRWSGKSDNWKIWKTKNIVQPKRRRRVWSFLRSSGKMDWELARYELLNHEHQWFDLFDVWISWQNHSFDYVSDFRERSFQISTYWNSRFLQLYFKFCHIRGVEVAFMLFSAVLKLKLLYIQRLQGERKLYP